MSEFKITYKCRMCGEVFSSGTTGESCATSIIAALSTNDNVAQGIIYGRRHGMHFCKNGDLGFTDFQGFRKVGL